MMFQANGHLMVNHQTDASTKTMTLRRASYTSNIERSTKL